MQMTVAEIQRSYSQAKNKKEYVSILAKLNRCTLKEILDIVHAERENDPEDPKEEWILTPEQKAFMGRLEELDGEIRKLEKEYEEVARRLCEGGAYYREVESGKMTAEKSTYAPMGECK